MIDTSGFIGTQAYHRLSMFSTVATDGVKYFCETLGCFWLFDEMSQIALTHENEDFIVFDVVAKDGKCSIRATNGNYKEIAKRIINFTDLEEGVYKFYAQKSIPFTVIMLPSEY